MMLWDEDTIMKQSYAVLEEKQHMWVACSDSEK